MAKAKNVDVAVEDVAVTRMGVQDFLPLYLEAVDKGLTREEFAAQIGVKPLTVYQRVNKLRKDGCDVPLLDGEEKPRITVAEKAAAILRAYKAK